MTPEDLARFRSRMPDCELAVLVDFEAGTVLGADMAIRLGQEYLDTLCAEAGRLFGRANPFAIHQAMIAGPLGTRLFLRAPDPAAEALCCLMATGADLAGATRAAEALLHEASRT